jgi:hypothetical protein
MSSLIDRHADHILGRIECLDRVVITGTLPGVCHARGMTSFLYAHGIRVFDYTAFAAPLREAIRENAQALAHEAGLEIEFIRKKDFRKEDRVADIVRRRGDHPGLVHVFSAMEPCASYKPWHDKTTHRTFLKPDSGKCLHYYFYFIDAQLGLCYLRVPTWCPFRLQFYFNGHNWLARQLDRRGIGYQLLDNALAGIDDFADAQRLADRFDVKALHRALDRFARRYCPVLETFAVAYHWSLMQVEYASDIVFKQAEHLQPLYEAISRTAIHAVKPDHVATFLGRKLHANFTGELVNHFHTRIQGTRIRHSMADKASIKMYDKFGRLLRIECTSNDVTFFQHYRKVEHRDGTSSMGYAPMKKTIHSLPALIDKMKAANARYLAFVSQIEDPTAGVRQVHKLSEPVRQNDRSLRGFNLFNAQDHALLLAIARGEFNISGMTNRALRRILPHLSGSQVSRLLKRLRVHGVLKKLGHSYKYYLTTTGRAVVLTALKLRDLVVIPSLTHAVAA